jgi:hypothetical protein
MSPNPRAMAPAVGSITDARTAAGLDTTRPSIARVYDYSLGGKDNFPADRAVFESILEVAPGHREVARMNRHCLRRMVQLMAMNGIEQFVDLGAGLPTRASTHEVAQLENRHAKVVYVDHDPVCTAHGRALLENREDTHFVLADLTEPDALMGAEGVVWRYLERHRPVGLLLVGVLHHVGEGARDDPAEVVGRYVELLPPGSYVAITHFWDPAEEDLAQHRLARAIEQRFIDGLGSGWYRTRRQIEKYFDGLELIAPGLVELDDFWPAGPPLRPRLAEQRLMLGAIGCKPDSAKIVSMR